MPRSARNDLKRKSLRGNNMTEVIPAQKSLRGNNMTEVIPKTKDDNA